MRMVSFTSPIMHGTDFRGTEMRLMAGTPERSHRQEPQPGHSLTINSRAEHEGLSQPNINSKGGLLANFSGQV